VLIGLSVTGYERREEAKHHMQEEEKAEPEKKTGGEGEQNEKN